MIDTVATNVGLPVIEMIHPIIGFPDDLNFTLVRVDEAGVVCELKSLDHDDLSFVVVPPEIFFPHYSLEIDDATVEDLRIEDGDDVQVLVILTMGDTLQTTTANLVAPFVINLANRRAAQIVVENDEFEIRTPVAA